MSLREEQCRKVCRILDNVLANRPTERDSLIVAVRKAFAEPQERKGKWININDGKWNTIPVYKCSACGEIDNRVYETDSYCPNCGAKMDSEQILSEADNDTAYGGLMSTT